jgi:hypothetical protein
MSGYITVGTADERCINLLMCEHSEYAYLLCLVDEETFASENTVVIKDFLMQ